MCVFLNTIPNNANIVQVLDLSRLESGKVEALNEIFDPAVVAAKCMAMIGAKARAKNIRKCHTLDLEHFSIVANGSQIHRSSYMRALI
jgi:signal transduction histidine kinase